MGTADYFDGQRWNRDRVVAAQRRRAEARAADFGWDLRSEALLTTPLPAAFVERFEHEHSVRLPAEYRSFLLEVGDGGDGPGLFMRPLGAPFDDSIEWEEGEIHAGPTEPNARLDEPFPLTEAETRDPTLGAALQTDAVPEELIVDATDGPPGPPGALFLFDHGCAMWDLLVVTGECAGQMWASRVAEGAPLEPIVRGGRRVGFADHYCAWLDESTDHA